MQPDILRQIVEAIIQDQLLHNWRFYALIGGLTFVATAAGHWLSSYLKKRGETFATKADMEEILRQVSVTTRVTEEVRSTVLQADWAAREWRTTRRLKLEELLAAAYSLDQWLDLQRIKWINAEEIVFNEAPMERMKLLATLYFPELKAEVNAVYVSHQQALIFILESSEGVRVARHELNVAGHKAALEKFTKDFVPLYQDTRIALVALEKKASALMAEVAGA